ncbi:hypothetical protein N7474_010532 [Penicillium riverlandense]|uniref:uncharacterized protein n=1 Tax=Penicillium riverlandense TaxID=1903569 RepID=UPI002546E6A1|nr:uncharacterized protein N7474_010532 [Penicillium riverlandense]KAJ5806940.1 hypothetical protein N7474_010532 [Penicillium riverlandense]
MAGSARKQKRSRLSDAASDKAPTPNGDRVKRRRFSENSISIDKPAVQSSDQPKKAQPWLFARPVGGRYTNLDPLVTPDEAYLFVGLETAVQVYATATSRLLRTLQVEAGHKVIGFRICPVDPEHLYIFTSSGFVTKWHWQSGKRLARWGTDCLAISGDLIVNERADHPDVLFFSLQQKEGKRQIVVNALGDGKLQGAVVMQTTKRISSFTIAREGRVIVAADGHNLIMGTTTSLDLESIQSVQYTWKEASLPVHAKCFHIRDSAPEARNTLQGSNPLDLAVGESGGSILVYQDVLNTLFGQESGRDMEKKSVARKLHWHRGPVNAVRWSKDGNYIMSGGEESVMVLWQLDTGRKQFLPHLSSPVCNIVVSPEGDSYVVKLADNSVMVLSARELQPSATVTGLQLCPEPSSTSSPVVAALHPQRPEQLLVAVPASHQSSQHDSQPASRAVLQTYDIRSNCHIARQALTRTNATTLSIGPEGSPILAPDVKYLDVAHDGKWLATTDTWTPRSQDAEAVDFNVPGVASANPCRSEVFLKFWKWSASSDTWELVTRIDGPHFTDSRHSSLLGLVSRPGAHEFATIGEDAFVRFWCPTARNRSGLKTNDEPQVQLDTWKCRGLIDLKGFLGGTQTTSLDTACLAFSEDGSVLAICLSAEFSATGGLVLLIDVRTCTVQYRRTGAFHGEPCTMSFLGKYLIISSTHSVTVWDTVDDIVRAIQSSESAGASASGNPQLLAVNPRNQTFAVAARGADGSSSDSTKKRRKNRSHMRIYDVPSFQLVFQDHLRNRPLALLSDASSGDYIVIDTVAHVQRLGCEETTARKSTQNRDPSLHLNSGLTSLFSRGHERNPAQPVDLDTPSQAKGLASVFGSTPSFSLPAMSVLFRNVVQSLRAE